MKILYMVMISLILLSGCSTNNSNTVEESQTKKESTVPTVKEVTETTSTKNNLKYLTVERPQGDTRQVPISSVMKSLPQLQTYIEESGDSEIELKRIHTRYLFQDNKTDYFLLDYACGNKLCEQAIIEYENDKVRSLYLSELSTLGKWDSNSSYIAVSLLVTQNPITRHQLYIIDRKEWRLLTLPESLAEVKENKWPIVSIEWKSHDEIQVTIPNLPNADYETIKEWVESKQKTTKTLTSKIN